MDQNRGSRLNKFEQKRKLTRLISVLVIVASVLLVFLIGIFVFSDSEASKQREQAATETANQKTENTQAKANKDQAEKQANKEQQTAAKETQNEKMTLEEKDKEKSDKEKEDKEKDKKKDDKKKDKKKDKLKKEKAEPSDGNVKKAYTANWKPIGTDQSGSHTTNYNDGSQDRLEMEKAIKEATGLSSMTTWWIGRHGEQQVQATVSSKSNENKTYRVNLEWVDGKGWKPVKVEELKKNDQQYRYR
ncbi:YrrS family protein [Aciduricibacillus chroicocephali]|uniref:YrrS family protein n=1 Tax=Aciduricibacillus chroicocephali TaxID=3054939 RepID=A0ABY9KSG2_9BACI|nr:YrrS family protein [Bacillaceae bacterium 44XB]